MRIWTASVALAFLLVSNVHAMTVKVTGYFPKGYKSKAQARVEGGRFDRLGNLLRTLQEYEVGSYVSVASDPRVVKTGTVFKIKEMPNIIFIACDVGRAIKGKHLDICVDTEKNSHKLPSKVTIEKIGVIKLDPHFRKRYEASGMFCRRIADAACSLYALCVQELARRNKGTQSVPTHNVLRNYEVASNAPVFSTSMGYRETGSSRFCHK